MSQKLLVNCFKLVKALFKFEERFIKNYDENRDKGYFLEVDVCPTDLHSMELHSIFIRIFYFYLKEIKFKKCNKLACKIQDKENYVVYIRALKQALNHGLIPKKVHRVIQFNQGAWLRPYIDMNIKLKTEAKKDFEKDFV